MSLPVLGQITYALHDFLKRRTIDPQKVKLIFRCDDEVTRNLLQIAIVNETMPLVTLVNQGEAFPMQINGIMVSVTTLDQSVDVRRNDAKAVD